MYPDERAQQRARLLSIADAWGLPEGLRSALLSSLQIDAPDPAGAPTVVDLPPPLVDETVELAPAGGPEVELELGALDLAPAERYLDLGLVGQGGLGEVRRVFDRVLDRAMVMKVLRADVLQLPHSLRRFVEEARITAQLQHPGIVPVHDLGRMADGRLYFTMKEVRGSNLAEVIREVHRAGDSGQRGGWTFRRLVDAFHRVCEAVAYAHSQGVIHRDLKPANVMVGRFGETLVLDWGLARVLGGPPEPRPEEVGEASLAWGGAHVTRIGTVVGTPSYMAPEQARGEVDRVGPASDVYALGCVLFEVLMGRPLHPDAGVMTVLREIILSPPEPQDLALEGPPELVELCKRALSIAPMDRPRDAGEMAEAIAEWLEGARAREKALAAVAEADALLPGIAEAEDRVAQLFDEANAILSTCEPYDPEAAKHPGWRLEDEALRLEREAELAKVAYVQHLRSAINHLPSLPEAHDRLADFYRGQHAAAEEQRDAQVAAQFEVLLRAHDRGRHAAWLKGDGALTLFSDPPGARVQLLRYVEVDRLLRAEPVRELGVTPLVEVPLPKGSWLLEIEAPGRRRVRYPVFIERQAHWDGVPPGADAPLPIHLPPVSALGPDDVYVPAGVFLAGGDPEAYQALPRAWRWVDAFVIRKHPVTNAEYLAFLDDLVAQGREQEALRFAPRERAAADGVGALLYGRDPSGRFTLQVDPDGDQWMPRWPVVMVDWFGAEAYGRWWAARSGEGWRLPGDLEWEKAARGVDGRFFPWGDFIDPTRANVRDSHPTQSRMAEVDAFPLDLSPYSVAGMAGNVLDWCADAFHPAGPRRGDALLRLCRGGSLACRLQSARLAKREGGRPTNRDYDLGFRLARRWVP